MAKCALCGRSSILISSFLGVCVDCIRQDFNQALSHIQEVRQKARRSFGLPEQVPGRPGGTECHLCVNACRVKAGEAGFCGLPVNSRKEAVLSWYYDPLPTNCVADWVCAGSSDFGYKNLAVFYQACNFDCSFCQNWRFRESLPGKKIPAEELAGKVDENTSCICFFGGDPTVQLPHSLLASQIAREWNRGKPLRVCWETNGSMNPQFLERMLEISRESGGCIKFDLKSWSESLNIALCGVTNRQTLENFASAAACFDRRPVPPLLVASTLLVPGYVDLFEVEKLAGFIARLNPSIPYSLLAFHPEFMMKDLPATSVSHAQEAKKIALKAGLKNVRIGNVHLLKETYAV